MKLEFPAIFGMIFLSDILRLVFFGTTFGLNFLQTTTAFVPAFVIFIILFYKGLFNKQISKKLGIGLISSVLVLEVGLGLLSICIK